GPMVDILDAQHRVGVPELFGHQRLAEYLDERGLVGIVKGLAIPVGHRAVELYLAAVAEMQDVFQSPIIWVARAIHISPGRGAHVTALAGKDVPAALGRGDHAVEGAE